MPRTSVFLSAAALAALIFSAAQAEPDSDTVVATVNGKEITIGHMIIGYATLPEQYRQIPAESLFDALLDQLIQQTLLQQSYGDQAPAHVELSLENERRSLLAGEAIETILASAATDEQVETAYQADYVDGSAGEEFNASHILVATKEEAEDILTKLSAGDDFAALARDRSTGPSGPAGGALGWLSRGKTVPEFEAAMVILEPGDVSPPVETEYGWHVIKLNDSRRNDVPDLEEVRAEIIAGLRRKAVTERVDSLRDEATIDRPQIDGLDRNILTRLDLVRN